MQIINCKLNELFDCISGQTLGDLMEFLGTTAIAVFCLLIVISLIFGE